MNKQNAAKVTKEVKVLTSDPDDMNEADAVLIADVIDSVVLLDDSLNEVKHEQNINGQTRVEPTEIRRCGPKTAGNSKNQIKIEMKSIRPKYKRNNPTTSVMQSRHCKKYLMPKNNSFYCIDREE